jgi:type I restriction enzyme S subunit
MSWKEKSLDELGLVARGKSKHRPRDAAHLYDGPYPFIQTGDVKHAPLYLSTYSKTYSEEGLKQSKLWKKGTLCITIAANIADTAILDIDACFPDSVIGFVANEEVCDTKFIKYTFNTLQQQYKQFSQGAAQDNLSLEKLLSIKFKVPPLLVQQKIAGILSAYDDLIDNNRKRIALLEKTARLLYEEWFVRLQFPGHEHTPVVNGVPEGWERKRLDEVAEVNARSLKNNFQGEIDYIDISAVSPGVIDGTTLYEFADAPGRARRIVKHGDVIWSCVRPNRKSYAVIWEPKPNLIASTGFAVLSPVDVPTSFLVQAVTTDAFVGYLNNNAKGAAYPAVTAKDFEAAKVLIPSQALLTTFEANCNPILSQAKALGLQNQKLQAARDLLLPRLMSGELAV